MALGRYTRGLILHWHVNGYTINEIMPLIPFCTRQEIEALIADYDRRHQTS